MDYLDFNLKIGPRIAENLYRVSVKSDAGEENGTFTLVPSYKPELPTYGAAIDFGEAMFRAIFADRILAVYSVSHSKAMDKHKGLRVKLTLDADELVNYPWEFLYDPSNAQFLCLFEKTPIIRYVELPRSIPPLKVTLPLRILAVASNPKDYESLNVEREHENLLQALEYELKIGSVRLDWIPRATFDALRERLSNGAYNIFHFIGHGSFDPKQRDGILVFEDKTGHSHQVNGKKLAVILGNHRTLRMATLNACEGARTSEQDPFAGMAMNLVRTGNLPAVVAMQFKISDEAAIHFAKGFYSAIIRGSRVEAAVCAGRSEILTMHEEGWEWASPVLNLRARDGILFKLKEKRNRLDTESTGQDHAVVIFDKLDHVIDDSLGKKLIDNGSYFKSALSGKTEDEPKDIAYFDENQLTPGSGKIAPSRISCVTNFVEKAVQPKHLIIVGARGDGKTFLNRQIEHWTHSIDPRWLVVNWKRFIPLFEERLKNRRLTLDSLAQDLRTTLERNERFDGVAGKLNYDELANWQIQFFHLRKMLHAKGIEGIFVSVDNLDKYSAFRDNSKFLEFLVSCTLQLDITEGTPPFYLRLFVEKTTYRRLKTKQWPWNALETLSLNWDNPQKQEILRLRAMAIQNLNTPFIPATELESMAQNAHSVREGILQLKKYYEQEMLKSSMASAEWKS